jgi:hypothetical protein
MNCLDALVENALSDYEMFKFLKEEVKRLNEENHRLQMKNQMAYTFGYEDAYRGLKFDHKFKIDDLDGEK